MPTYGQRPDDVVQDSRGNALSGVTIRLYGSQTSAEAGGTPLATAVTDSRGRWVYEAAAGELWARLPDTTVWQITDPNNLEDYLNITEGDARYYTQAQVDSAVAAEADARGAADAGKSDVGHTHDDRYYTEAEVDSLIAGTVTQSALDDEIAARTGADVTLDGRVTALEGSAGGVTDHGALTGLADDDHTQYALADGSRGSFEVAGAVAAHSADTTLVHGIADTSELVTSATVTTIWSGTQAAYDALGSWDSSTLYVITG